MSRSIDYGNLVHDAMRGVVLRGIGRMTAFAPMRLR